MSPQCQRPRIVSTSSKRTADRRGVRPGGRRGGGRIHTASPDVLTVRDPQRDLVDPAVHGTLNVLRSCAKAPRVRRVALTSSMAAITDEPDSGRAADGERLEREEHARAKSVLLLEDARRARRLAIRARCVTTIRSRGHQSVHGDRAEPDFVRQHVEPVLRRSVRPGFIRASSGCRSGSSTCATSHWRMCSRWRRSRLEAATSAPPKPWRCARSSSCSAGIGTRETGCPRCRSTARSVTMQ